MINNRYNLLPRSDKDGSETISSSAVQQSKFSGVNTKRNLNKNLKKIIILGDSHARGCAQEVQHNLGHDFEVQGTVKLGADSEIIVNTSNK